MGYGLGWVRVVGVVRETDITLFIHNSMALKANEPIKPTQIFILNIIT